MKIEKKKAQKPAQVIGLILRESTLAAQSSPVLSLHPSSLFQFPTLPSRVPEIKVPLKVSWCPCVDVNTPFKNK